MAEAAAPPVPRRFARLRRPALVGVLAGLGSVLAYGTSQVLTRRLVTTAAPPQVGAALTVLFGMVYLFLLALPRLKRDLRAPKRALASAFLAGLLSAIAVLAVYFAFSRAPVVVVAPITAISPLLSLVLTALFLRRLETITPRVVLGALLVVAGVVLVVLGRNA